ncbi:MAG: hypothetical protein JST89_07175 [Cyanobacteria bacterium SZAS-4]|nr:hypothetical protein [Cyanobacteria bacterium SZAS-4]
MQQFPRRFFALALSLISFTVFAFSLPAFSTPAQTAVNSSEAVGPKIAATAQACLGKKMWLGYGLKTGYLGCAAAVSNVLKKAGSSAGHSAAVTQLRNQLLASKCAREFIIRRGPKEELLDSKLNSIARPGDIVLAFAKPPESDWNGGGNAHCGILSAATEICTNDWNDGIWKKLNIHLMFDYYPYLRIIRIDRLSSH